MPPAQACILQRESPTCHIISKAANSETCHAASVEPQFATFVDAYSRLLDTGVPAVGAHAKAHACLQQRCTALCWRRVCLSSSCLKKSIGTAAERFY